MAVSDEYKYFQADLQSFCSFSEMFFNLGFLIWKRRAKKAALIVQVGHTNTKTYTNSRKSVRGRLVCNLQIVSDR